MDLNCRNVVKKVLNKRNQVGCFKKDKIKDNLRT